MKQARGYVSYLLRLWRAGDHKDAVWWASLESPMTGEKRGFASLRDLFAFLETQTDASTPKDGEDDVLGDGKGD